MDIQKIIDQYLRLLEEGKLPEGERLLTEALEEAKAQGKLAGMLTIENELEGLYRTTGRTAQAVEVSEHVLTLIDRLGLTNRMPHAVTLLNSATALRAAGDPERALERYRRAEAILTELGQEKSYQMTALYNNVSQAYLDLGKAEEALHYQEKALAQLMEFPNHEAEAATTQICMAQSLMTLKRMEEAADAIREAFAYYETAAGRSDPHRSTALAAKGEYYFRMAEDKEAAVCFQEALELALKYYGECDLSRGISRNLETIRKKQEAEQ